MQIKILSMTQIAKVLDEANKEDIQLLKNIGKKLLITLKVTIKIIS